MKRLLAIALALTISGAEADTKDDIATLQTQLTKLVEKAQKKDINTLKEETSLRTAEIFLDYVKWDEKNINKNVTYFKKVTRYKTEAEKYARLLPEFELSEIKKMLEDGILELNEVIDGKLRRLESPNIDWAKCKVENDQITFDGKPVFLADWTWKPQSEKYCQYHGNLDGFFTTPSHVINSKGDISPKVYNELKSKESGSLGFIFLNHSSTPKWAVEQDPTIKDGAGYNYTMYDINNPLCRQIQSNLISKIAAEAAGKKYSELGYMLCNEPHWNIIDGWTASPLSDYAVEEFRNFLEEKHGSIEELNSLWGTDATSFKKLKLPKILAETDRGTALWHDMTQFNMERINEWFRFLRGEIQKADPQAKTHIKIIPSMWTDNGRVHGIDLETLTRESEINGNDAGSCGAWMWGKPHIWEKRYSFDILDLTMAYDFMKSVSPNKVNFNTEGHMLSTGKTRDLYTNTQYVRCNFYLAHIQGMTVSQNWYWSRREDGSSRDGGSGYAGSNNHQPRVVNAVHTTMLELNSISDKIMAFQRQSKDIRLFMSNAGAIVNDKYMSNLFSTYEKVLFEGASIGFATSGIAEHDGFGGWKVVVVAATPNVYRKDIETLQKYLDCGGTVILDSRSLKFDEYGRKIEGIELQNSKGKLIKVTDSVEACKKALEVANSMELLPSIKVNETNELGLKGCYWRVIENKKDYTLYITNLGKTNAKIDITLANGTQPKAMEDIISGKKITSIFELKPNDLYMLKVTK